MNRNFRSWCVSCGLAVTVATAAGCTAARASAPAGPPLRVPDAPPRVLILSEEPSLPESVGQPAAATPAPAESTPPPVVRVPRPAPSPPPAGTVETKPSAPRTFGLPGAAARERAIRERIEEVSRGLALVNVAALGAADRIVYDQARRFIQQAEEAVMERDFVFAATLADKAASLALDLASR